MITKAKINKYLSKALIYLVLSVMTVIAMYPAMYILLSSFKTSQEILVGGVNIFPTEWQFQNYVIAWERGNFSTYTFNSLYMSFFIVIGCIFTATIAGYVFARGKTLFSRVVYTMVLSSLFVSIGVLSLYPQLMLANALGIGGSLFGVILIHVFGMNVTQVFLSTSFIRQIPTEIDEAAKIDGCGFARIYASIIFPLIRPLMATVGLISFRLAWSDYLLPYVFTIANPSRRPLVVGVISLRTAGQAATSWDLMFAGISISLIPMMVVYLILNRFFISGLTEGAVKG